MTRPFFTLTLIALAAAQIWTAARATAQTVDISWHTIDGGGAMFSTGATYSLGGSIGQPDAGSFSTPMSGGPFELVGGFWPVASASPPSPPCPGDVNGDGVVDLSDLAILLSHFGTTSGGSWADGDFNSDEIVDLTDLAILLSRFGTTC